MAENRVIGLKNALPWPEPIPADWEHLEKVTKGKKMIMGKSSYDNPHRVWSAAGNLVLSRKKDLPLDPGFAYADSLPHALEIFSMEEELFVIGGQKVFEEAISLADTIYLTTVHQVFRGDTFFPELDRSNYHAAYQQFFKVGEGTPYPMTIEKLVRI